MVKINLHLANFAFACEIRYEHAVNVNLALAKECLACMGYCLRLQP